VPVVAEFALTARADGHRFDDREANGARQRGTIEAKTPGARQVGHVQGDHHGSAQALQFQYQAQVQAQVRGIHHADDEIGGLLGGVAPQHDVPRDGLIQGGGLQAVSAWQVQQAIAVGPGLLWSDGHATVIANFYEEIETHNRPRGSSAVLRLLYPL